MNEAIPTEKKTRDNGKLFIMEQTTLKALNNMGDDDSCPIFIIKNPAESISDIPMLLKDESEGEYIPVRMYKSFTVSKAPQPDNVVTRES